MQMQSGVAIKRQNIVNIMSQHEEFLIIGLTGKNGSGCSEAAQVFASSYKELELPWIQPNTNGFKDDEERDKRILQRYASAHWLKFDVIKIRSIITTFLLGDADSKKFDDFIGRIYINSHGDTLNEKDKNEKVEEQKKILYQKLKDKFKIEKIKYKEEIFSSFENDRSLQNFKNAIENTKKYNEEFLKKSDNTEEELINPYYDLCQELGDLYQKADENNGLNERSRFLFDIEKILFRISNNIACIILSKNDSNSIWTELSELNSLISKKYHDHNYDTKNTSNTSDYENLFCFTFAQQLMPALSDIIHDDLKHSPISYTELYQKFGNSIRRYGDIIFDDNNSSNKSNGIDIFSIPRKTNQFIKALRHPFYGNNCRPVRVVIDSIKNVFEATYLRQRYSAFYLFSISADESIRKDRLMRSEGKNMTMRQINFVDWNEFSSLGYNIFLDGQKNKLSEDTDMKEFYNHVTNESDNDVLIDKVRLEAYQNKQYQYYLQDVAASIENADVFISNNHCDKRKNMNLRWEIVRNVCLIMFPGLLVPTPVERCMQIAFAAKCNSGCLSRQVGAVVTNKNFDILSIGWNDVPCGDISCSRKNLVDLCKGEDQNAYSKYELDDDKFREKLSKFDYGTKLNKLLRGLPMRYCFKDIHQDERNPMRSRAMHAEEKALASCGENAYEGYLFTTSSPCEMCSKNAKNHRIKRIYYIELYPGISEAQYSQSGDPENIAKHILYTGAVGRAYTQMYTPIMPQKDIIDFLGVNSICWKS